MKKFTRISLGVLLAVVLFSVTGCNKKPLVANYALADMNACVTQSAHDVAQNFSFTLSHSDLVNTVSSAGVKDLSRVTSVKLNKLKAVVATTGDNFDQIGLISVYLKTSNTPNDSVQVAYTSPAAAGTTDWSFNFNGVDLSAALTYDATISVTILPVTTGTSAKCIKLTTGNIEMQMKND